MIKEIYCRMPSDANYKRSGSVIESTSMEENLLQRIRVCLGTRKGEVLGDPFFGINLEDYIFDMGVDKDEIESDVKMFLTEYAMNGYEDFYAMDINVSFGKDLTSPTAPHDYILIDIYLNNQKSMGVLVS